MKIEQSSAEFELNSNFTHAMFGTPRATIESGIYGHHIHIPEGSYEAWRKVSKPLASGDIAKLSMWDNYRDDIKALWNPDSTALCKDIFGGYWVSIGGTGWAAMWSVGLGTLESGKYPV